MFGFGDGGGGPTPAMLETLRRAPRPPGRAAHHRSPRPTSSSTALEADAADRPTIVGELYFEYHRGTYTSQAAVKRGNRAGERALHDAELLSAVASRLHGLEYPAEAVDQAWQLLLLNQFHDILPGSSIALVYERAAAEHAEVLAAAEAATHQALAALKGDGQGATPVNVLSSARSGVAEHPDGELVWVDAPAYGFGTVGTSPGEVKVSESAGTIVLENALLRAEIGTRRPGAVADRAEHRPRGAGRTGEPPAAVRGSADRV